jgi:ArsR family transcriptional regulator
MGVFMENESISKIKEAILRNNEVLDALADLYKVFADSTRVKILVALTQSEMCVGEISEFLEITQSAVSHQLRVLKTGGLVKCKREGKSIIYSLADAHVRTMIDCGMQHIAE